MLDNNMIIDMTEKEIQKSINDAFETVKFRVMFGILTRLIFFGSDYPTFKEILEELYVAAKKNLDFDTDVDEVGGKDSELSAEEKIILKLVYMHLK
jgi:hypothetical protein